MWVHIWHFIAGVANVKWVKFIADEIVADCCSDSFTYTQRCAGRFEFVFLLSVSHILFLSKLMLSWMNIMSFLSIQHQKFVADVNITFNGKKILLSLSHMLRTNMTFKKNTLKQVHGWSVDSADCQEVSVLGKLMESLCLLLKLNLGFLHNNL